MAMAGAGQPGGLAVVPPVRAHSRHLLFPDPDADAAPAEEGPGIPGRRSRSGDKIVTTGGIYGQITRVNDKSVQVQIADKVRIEIARAAVGGYQGQEPVVPESGNS